MSSSIKIVHTADNHIGKQFRNYPPVVKDRLVNERFEALQRIVERANDVAAHFVVVAGDLFDNHNVAVRDIRRVGDILSKFNGQVLILPGNHDFYENTSNGFWQKFQQLNPQDNLQILGEYEPLEYNIGDRKIKFYPAACQSKHSAENMIGWVSEYLKARPALQPGGPDVLNIGIAHGNVEGLGLGADRYFNMLPAELRSAGMDCWLLGHIHVPYPEQASSINPGFLFAATHTPDSFDYKKDGCCWYLEFDEEKKMKMEQWRTGAIRFYQYNLTLLSEMDIETMNAELSKIDQESSLVKIHLSGRLTRENLKHLNQECERLKEVMLYCEIHNTVGLNIDRTFINGQYTQASLPHKLLTSLADEAPNDLALQLAHQLMEEVKQ